MELIQEYAKTMKLRIARYRIDQDLAETVDLYHVGIDMAGPERIVARGAILGSNLTAHAVTAERISNGAVMRERFGEPSGYPRLDEEWIIPRSTAVPELAFNPFNLPMRVMGPDGEPMDSPSTGEMITFTGTTVTRDIPEVSFVNDVWFDITLSDGTVIRAQNFSVNRSENQEEGT